MSKLTKIYETLACQRKQKFNDERTAYKVLKKMLYKMQSKDSARLGIYQCKVCGGWHLGKK